DYYKDAPVIENITDKPRKEDRKKEKKEKHEIPTDEEKARRTAARGMARMYVSVGKRDGFYAGNLIDMLNHLVPGQRVNVGRIDLLPTYTLFDVKKSDAGRVSGALKGAEFFGKRLHCEQADADKDYTRLNAKKGRFAATEQQPFAKFRKKR
ncbi:MAG: DbpA RNA binding domain-containing protein, partial [Muribaculaceae bacterium]|nr:DbpA RNA binding domain-containing protein [Muribaculaceae bacterium]